MATPIPATLADLRTLVTQSVSSTSVFSRSQVLQAINYGYKRALRAVRAVRPQHTLSYVDEFTFAAGVSEYDISAITPCIWRPVKLIVPRVPAETSQTGGGRTVLFQYRDFRDQDFLDRESTPAGTFERVVYDILEGLLPKTVAGSAVTTTIAVQLGGNLDQIEVADASSIVIGDPIKVLGVGQGKVLDAENAEPDYTLDSDYFGRVTGKSGVTITVSPRMRAEPAIGVGVTTFRTRILTIAPALATSLTGRLYYMTQRERLQKDTDVLDASVSEHQDVVVAYAMAWLLRTVNDMEAERWFGDAQEMRAELMQDLEPMSAENTEALSSGLAGIGDY